MGSILTSANGCESWTSRPPHTSSSPDCPMVYIYLGKYRSSPCVSRTLWLGQRRTLRSRPKRSRMNAFRVWRLGLYRCYILEFSQIRFADIVNRFEAGEGPDYDRILAPNNGDDESWIQSFAAPERLKWHCSISTEIEVYRKMLYFLSWLPRSPAQLQGWHILGSLRST